MLLSIVIPAYNVESYIEQCIDSILEQIDDSIEIIVVNDGSTDFTSDKLKMYSSIKVIEQFNGGQSKARNRGLEEAIGQFIWFVDSDDVISENAINIIISNLNKFGSSVDIVAFEGEYFIEGHNDEFNVGQLNYYRPNFDSEILSQRDFFNTCIEKNSYFVQPCHFVISRNVASNIKFEEGIIYEDNLFTTDVFIKAERRIMVINKKLYNRRIRLHSTITSEFTEKNIMSFKKVVDELIAKRPLYSNFVDSKYLDTYISSIIDSYYISLLRVRPHSIRERIKHFFEMLMLSRSLISMTTLILALIPTSIYNFRKLGR